MKPRHLLIPLASLLLGACAVVPAHERPAYRAALVYDTYHAYPYTYYRSPPPLVVVPPPRVVVQRPGPVIIHPVPPPTAKPPPPRPLPLHPDKHGQKPRPPHSSGPGLMSPRPASLSLLRASHRISSARNTTSPEPPSLPDRNIAHQAMRDQHQQSGRTSRNRERGEAPLTPNAGADQ
ncbi:MAG: hypothetical protein RBR77_01870 [Thauera sp.]|jgi:hypothetical protein|nr:hypothetical protein [Thauera sp.]